MWNHFFKHIDIDPKNVHILDGNAADLIEECDQFERAIKEAGGIELFVGGIGPDGHIAFNEPGNESSSDVTDHCERVSLFFSFRIQFGITNPCENLGSRYHRGQCSILR